MNLDKLFKHLADEHGLLILESEKREIADCLLQCGLTESEYMEHELLLEKQRSTMRRFSQEEFDRLKELSNKMFANRLLAEVVSLILKEGEIAATNQIHGSADIKYWQGREDMCKEINEVLQKHYR